VRQRENAIEYRIDVDERYPEEGSAAALIQICLPSWR
jgi:hypothetical protein